jgi:hypothetical protein
MTLNEFMELLLTVDPNATRYYSMQQGNYTIWQEYGADHLPGDNKYLDRKWRIQVDRFTKIPDDPVVDAITAVLDREDIAFSYQVDFEMDTKYIHHIWDCEVV